MSEFSNVFSQLDTLFEWEEVATAFIILLISFGVGSFFAIRIFKLLSGLAFLGVFYYVMYQVAQGFWTDWQQLASAALGIGFLLSFLVVPFSITAEFEERISKLEKEG